jgi:hypothetical protein
MGRFETETVVINSNKQEVMPGIILKHGAIVIGLG